MSDKNMLSQEEIDALLKGTGPGEGDNIEPMAGESAGSGGQETAEQQDNQDNQDNLDTKDLKDTPDNLDTQDNKDNQENIDEQKANNSREETFDNMLSQQEKDALGEVGNISMGTAATALSELLNQRVVITSPKVRVMSREDFFNSFTVPNITIQVNFEEGLSGYNILVIKMKDAIVMADLMMGGSGDVQNEEIGEIELSAASEAMNQMIGSASTSLSSMFGMPISISPPITNIWYVDEEHNLSLEEEVIVVVSFDMEVGSLLDTEIMQVLSVETAKKQVELMMKNLVGGDEEEPAPGQEFLPGSGLEPDIESDIGPAVVPETGSDAAEGAFAVSEQDEDDEWLKSDFWSEMEQKKQAEEAVKEKPTPAPQQKNIPQALEVNSLGLSPEDKKKLELLLDVPLKVSVILGRTKKPIKEVLGLTPGSIIELNSLVDEPVEILVNGTLVAKGEVVVVNENFGVRINYILSPQERLMQLK